MKCLYINIDTDLESRIITEVELKRVGIKAERLSATVEDNRVLAFNKSVYRAMVTGIRYFPDDLLLFEDDVAFEVGFYIMRLEDIIASYLPKDFMTLHLGANIIGVDTTKWQMPTSYNAKLAKLHNAWQSHATLYSAECVKYILDNFKYVTDEYKTEGVRIFDDWLRTEVLSQGRSYILNPMVAWQRPRKSEIWNTESDYTYCHKKGNEILSKIWEL